MVHWFAPSASKSGWQDQAPWTVPAALRVVPWFPPMSDQHQCDLSMHGTWTPWCHMFTKCVLFTLHSWSVCFCHPNRITAHLWCTPFVMAQMVLCIESLQCMQNISGWMLTSSPDVSMSNAIFSSAENALHSRFFALYFVILCPQLYNVWEVVGCSNAYL